MMQNSLQRLFAGMAEVLRDGVLPAVDDEFARSQVSACIELLGNLATRVEWRRDDLEEVARRAETSIAATIEAAPDIVGELPPAGGEDPVAVRDSALRRVSGALRWCALNGQDDAAAPLVEFASWHLEHELARLRTGMFTS